MSLELSTEIHLPPGFTARPLTMNDAEAAVKLFAIAEAAQNLTFNVHPDEIRADWQSPKFNLESSSLAIFNAQGEMVGTVEVWDTHEVPVHPYVEMFVHPDYYAVGIGETLLAWGLETARRVIPKCPENALISAASSSAADYEPQIRLMESFGMKSTRYFFRMRIDMTEQPPLPQLPQGFSFRNYNHPDELADVVKADDDGFRDHYGYVEQPIELKLDAFKHWIETDPLFDPTLWHLVIDDATGNIAATCITRPEAFGEAEVAYVNKLSVRKDYRQKGLGLAMLHQAFNEFYKRGKNSVTLHVDASSITGAVRLYERAGMHVEHRSVRYEAILRDGEEVARV